MPKKESASIPTFMLAAAPRAHTTIDYTLILHSAGACVLGECGLAAIVQLERRLEPDQAAAHSLT